MLVDPIKDLQQLGGHRDAPLLTAPVAADQASTPVSGAASAAVDAPEVAAAANATPPETTPAAQTSDATGTARNVFEDLEGVAPVVSMEEVYKRNPEIIVSASSAVSEGEFHAQWREHPTLSAVRTGKLVFVEPDRIQRLTARTPDGIAALCAAIERVR